MNVKGANLDVAPAQPLFVVVGLQFFSLGLIGEMIKVAKVIKTGELTRKVTLKGVGATAGARTAIEAVGGSVA